MLRKHSRPTVVAAVLGFLIFAPSQASAASFTFDLFTLDNFFSSGDDVFSGFPYPVPHLIFDDPFTGTLSFEYKASDGFGLWASDVPITEWSDAGVPPSARILFAFGPVYGLECPFPSQPDICNPSALIFAPVTVWLEDITVLNFGIGLASGTPSLLLRDITATPIPEPATMFLVGGGLLWGSWRAHRRRSARP